MPGTTCFETTNDNYIRVDRYENGKSIGGFVVSREMLKFSIDSGFGIRVYNEPWRINALEYLKLFKP